jgi:hypothetical protein
MDASLVLTVADFRRFISSLAETYADHPRSLEHYLRALWAGVEEHKSDPVRYALLAQLLAEAYTREPLPFDTRWLARSTPPDEYFSTADAYEYLRRMLMYQIADLHKMDQAGMLDNPHRFLGINSPTGYIWYNFHPSEYLGCATGGLREDSLDVECNWGSLAKLLWLGQIYE